MVNGMKQAAVLPREAGGESGFRLETGTALDYLWEAQEGGLFEPVEPQLALAGEAGQGGQNAAPTCLTSTLERYNSWLASFDLYQSILAQEHQNIGQNHNHGESQNNPE